jgi:ADP-ribose pyrophosphatase YjhB (NUDIX family)
MDNNIYCKNCGKPGHMFHKCKMPISSFGVIVFRFNRIKNKTEYLMVCRKETLGYIDFMRGKYSVQNKDYIVNMVRQMTREEKELLKMETFDNLWVKIWGSTDYANQYKNEEIVSREKYNILKNGVVIKNDYYSLSSIIDEINETDNNWEEPEWGFPKGRRNNQENDYICAIREFCEETGYSKNYLMNIQNALPYEEIFIGSNYKSYKHKYYLMYMDYEDSLKKGEFQKSEISKMDWKTINECLDVIRPYNLEKRKIIQSVDQVVNQNMFYLINKENGPSMENVYV